MMSGLVLALALLGAQDPVTPPAAALARALEAEDDPAAAAKLVAQLHALYASDPAVKPEAVAAVRAARHRKIKAIEGRLELGELRDRKGELQRRREAALKVIGDPKVYLPEAAPAFKQGDEANGQKAVDALVSAVQELWDAPRPVAVDPVLRADAKAVVEAAAKALALFGEADPDPVLLHNLSLDPLDVRSFALDAREVEAWLWNRKVDRYNEGLADPDVGPVEKQGAAVINGYRERMGRRRLFLDARLCRSSKKHSIACNAAQKIWHAGPDGDPQTRARLEAFPNPVAENVAIAFADGLDVWKRGWFRASDHHRNGISEAWTCMGYGYVGNVGTQTFANIPPPKSLK